MTDHHKKRKHDVDEVNIDISQGILDILNEDFPQMYLSLQLYQYFKSHPIPTDISIYNKCKYDPYGLINDFYHYLNTAVTKYLGESYIVILSSISIYFFKGNSFTIDEIDFDNESKFKDKILLVPKGLLSNFPKFVSKDTYIWKCNN